MIWTKIQEALFNQKSVAAHPVDVINGDYWLNGLNKPPLHLTVSCQYGRILVLNLKRFKHEIENIVVIYTQGIWVLWGYMSDIVLYERVNDYMNIADDQLTARITFTVY